MTGRILTAGVISLAVIGTLVWGGAGDPAARAASPPGFTVNNGALLDDGQPWTPYGFTLSTFQDGTAAFAANEYTTSVAELNALKGTWHGNTLRLQVEQDEFLYGGGGMTASTYRYRVYQVISYAESIGLAVVLNCQTEAAHGIYTHHEPLPTTDTVRFWQYMEKYRYDRDIIVDPFNEPRLDLSSAASSGWPQWWSGTGSYIGIITLIKDIRGDGLHQELWVNPPGSGLTELSATWPKYRLTFPDVVYEYHHVSTDENALPSVSEWNASFGNLVTVRHQPVVDGEWTNRTAPPGTPVYSGSGDAGVCWGNAPVSVPAYLAYLAARHIGMTVWTLGDNSSDPGRDYINADGDTRTFTTANSYAGWNPSNPDRCLYAPGVPTQGAGQDLMAWFAQQNP